MTEDESTQFDQLSVIFEVIGSPSKEDIEVLQDEKVRAYLSKMRPVQPRLFRSMFPGADPRAEDLLTRMLQFNPAKRISVDEALEHPFLVDVRNQDAEVSAWLVVLQVCPRYSHLPLASDEQRVAPFPVSIEVEEVPIEENTLRERILYEVQQVHEQRRRVSFSHDDAKSDGSL